MSQPASHFDGASAGDLGRRMVRLMVYILLSVTLMGLDYRGRYIDQARQAMGLVVEPVLLLIEVPYSLSLSALEQLRDRRQLQTERDEFERLLRESRAHLLLLQEFERENAQLRDLLGASQALAVDFQPVELRHLDLNPYSHRVMIGHGRHHGLRTGQAVIDARGVMGQLDEVRLRSATVVLISDPDHALPVKVARTGLRTIAYGSGRSDELRLTDLPMNVDLEPGDQLLTSGLGGRFPPGLPVATVTEIDRPDGRAFALALARPAAELAGARHLLVLRSELDDFDDLADQDVPLTEPAEVQAGEGGAVENEAVENDPAALEEGE